MSLQGSGFADVVIPTSCSALREFGHNTISWNFDGKCSDFNLQRRVDGGAWFDMPSPLNSTRSAIDQNSNVNGIYDYRIRSRRGGKYSEWSNAPQLTVSDAGPSSLITESDISYDGSFRMPASVTFTEGGGYTTGYGTAAIAYRGKGGVDRILMTAHNYSNDRVYEVTVPELGTVQPYPLATQYIGWGNIYGLFKYIANVYDEGTVGIVNGVVTLTGGVFPGWAAPSGESKSTIRIVGLPNYTINSLDGDTQLTLDDLTVNVASGTEYEVWYWWGSTKTGGLFIDPANWDRLFWNHLQWYSGGPEPSWGECILNDATGLPTAVACRRLSGVGSYQSGGGCLRIPAAFEAAHCPNKPYAVGFGTAWMSTSAAASYGPCYRAVPDPDIVTYPNKSSVPNVVLLRHASHNPPPGELNARRTANDRKNVLFGYCQAGTDTTQIVMQGTAYAAGNYDGASVGIYEGPGAGQTGTLSWISGLTYAVTPNFTVAPVAGESKYEVPTGGPTDDGYYTIYDGNAQSTVWVTGSKQGVLVLQKFIVNRYFYGPGGPHFENSLWRMRVYDPDDFAAVIAGTMAHWEPEAKSEWNFVLPDLPALLGYDDSSQSKITLDQANRKLYINNTNGWYTGLEWKPTVHRFSIAGSN